jgi:hypothetical protein
MPNHKPATKEQIMAVQKVAREVWRAIPGYDGYEVSSLGRVRSIDREVVQVSPWGGMIRRRLRGKILATGCHPDGHLLVNLSVGNVPASKSVHNLVLLTFVGKRPRGLEACHNDGDPENNRLSNLRYDTHLNNEADKLTHGTRPRGERHGNSHLTREQVIEIRDSKLMGRLLAKTYGVSPTQICNIRKRKAWGWIR